MKLLAALFLAVAIAHAEETGPLHIPIGIPGTVDTLKTFVESDGSFSPGFGTFGVSFNLPDNLAGIRKANHGLSNSGLLIPWAEVQLGDLSVRTELCEVKQQSPTGEIFVVAARVRISNTSEAPVSATLSVAITPEGPAGGPIHGLTFSKHAFNIEGHPVLIAESPSKGAALASGPLEPRPFVPQDNAAVTSSSGDCRGEMLFDLTVPANDSVQLGFICPVLPGRVAVGHRWDGVSKWAQLDLADPIAGDGGKLQPDPGLEFYRTFNVEALFADATAYWKNLIGKVSLDLPDSRWSECFAAITGHAALAMNEGAPDVAVINYNVFNRDGVYVANILQKSGNAELAAKAIDYFLAHPFNGRVEPEADNPGQVLWILGEHWRFTRDREWLTRVWPAARKFAAMIEYYRTTPEPHWVNATSLEFGEALPTEKRQRLRPGACDGTHPEYTEAFDIAGLQAAALLAQEMKSNDATKWASLANQLAKSYDDRFGANLRKNEYGNYCVLWPCRLYPLDGAQARNQFSNIGAQKPTSWRYFPLARAHQGLLAGNRSAAAETIAIHLDHPQMQGWYAFDEGGPSGPGNWGKVRTNWPIVRNPDGSAKSAMAMPHGWAIAEMQLLLRDALAFEDSDRLVLFAGVPEAWFAKPMTLRNFPTHFGALTVEWLPDTDGGTFRLSGDAAPKEGFIVRTPKRDVPVAAGEKLTRIDLSAAR